MKNTLLFVLAVASLLAFSSCSALASESVETIGTTNHTTEESGFNEEKTTVPEETSTEEGATTNDSTTDTEIHEHRWRESEVHAASCQTTGFVIRTCSCGEMQHQVLPVTGHDAMKEATCTESAVCRNCHQHFGRALGHNFLNATCQRCQLTVTSTIFVLDSELNYDENISSVTAKLGMPTEIVREGEITSLVYASDLSRFTVIQTDSYGLWGVYTFDQNALFHLQGVSVSFRQLSSFEPYEPYHAKQKQIGSDRVLAFFDDLGDANPYALWFCYQECEYDVVADPQIANDYSGQSSLSYHLINAIRYRHGLAPLTRSQEAVTVAEQMCTILTEVDVHFFDHDGRSGERLSATGVRWEWFGENISRGYPNVYFVMDAYYHSAEHRSNLLHQQFERVGCFFLLRPDTYFLYGAQIFYS